MTDVTWTCDGCGNIGPWGPTWAWYGAILDLDNGSQIVVACSAPCQDLAQGKYRPRTYKKGYQGRTIYGRANAT